MRIRVALLAVLVSWLLLPFAACHKTGWTHATAEPCSLVSKSEAEKAMGQPVREPVPHEFYATNQRDRKEIELLIEKGLLWMKTCSYNGLQDNLPMDFLVIYIYQFSDNTKAESFYKDNTKTPVGGKGRWTESLAGVSRFCDKSAGLYGINGTELWVLKSDVVFSLDYRGGMDGDGSKTWGAADSLLPIAVQRLQ